MNYYNNFEEIETTGNTIRRKNKIKAQNLMNIAVSFNDEETLQKIQKIFQSLSPEEMMAFKNYLDDRKYLKSSNHNSAEQKVIGKIVGVALASVPKDERLKKIHDEYIKNLNMIDELKVQSQNTTNFNELNKLIEQINEYGERNVVLLEQINQ